MPPGLTKNAMFNPKEKYYYF